MDTQRQRIKMGGGHLFFFDVCRIDFWMDTSVCVCVFVYHICASMQRKC